MLGHFGFSYVGLIFMIMLMVPNIIWAKNQPQGYTAENENKVLAVFERIGEVLATCCALVFSDFNLRAWSLWSLWLVASFVLMIMYEFWWIRYFRSERRLSDFYSSFCGVPLAGATLPVLALSALHPHIEARKMRTKPKHKILFFIAIRSFRLHCRKFSAI